MEELNKKQHATKEAVLVSQVRYTAASMYHGAGRTAIDCQAGLFPHLFQDSKVAKVYDIRFIVMFKNSLAFKLKFSRRTKLTYFATHGLYPYFHDKLVKVNIYLLWTHYFILFYFTELAR